MGGQRRVSGDSTNHQMLYRDHGHSERATNSNDVIRGAAVLRAKLLEQAKYPPSADSLAVIRGAAALRAQLELSEEKRRYASRRPSPAPYRHDRRQTPEDYVHERNPLNYELPSSARLQSDLSKGTQKTRESQISAESQVTTNILREIGQKQLPCVSFSESDDEEVSVDEEIAPKSNNKEVAPIMPSPEAVIENNPSIIKCIRDPLSAPKALISTNSMDQLKGRRRDETYQELHSTAARKEECVSKSEADLSKFPSSSRIRHKVEKISHPQQELQEKNSHTTEETHEKILRPKLKFVERVLAPTKTTSIDSIVKGSVVSKTANPLSAHSNKPISGHKHTPTQAHSPRQQLPVDKMRDPGYRHAQKAGLLWQTLVGEHVRFPKTWFDGQRTPMMGSLPKQDTYESPRDKEVKDWMYIAKHRVKGNPTLQQIVRVRRSRGSQTSRVGCKGRLLLHIVVQDQMTWTPVQDLVLGCFHPKYAAGDSVDQIADDVRDIWMAVRRRRTHLNKVKTLVDPFLIPASSVNEYTLEGIAKASPFGNSRRSVTNENVASVFGEKPPVRTLMMTESNLYEKICAAKDHSIQTSSSGPAPSIAILLVQEFLFKASDQHY